jgi:hypothetical protein
MALAAEGGFDEVAEEPRGPWGLAKRRAGNHGLEGREHLTLRDFAGCIGIHWLLAN